MTRGGGKRAAIGIALLIIALAGVAALASFDSSSGIGGGGIAAAQATTDYDDDNDGLIDVTTLAQLNAMRWDLNGDGDVASTDAANYLLAFPSRDTNAATRMGCPSGTCTGYELRADLDFDTDDDGDVDSSDSPSFPNWTPIGTTAAYTATFSGNNYTISNLTINDTVASSANKLSRVGLFGRSNGAAMSGVGLVDVNITASVSASGNIGSLVGAQTTGSIRSCYATGSIRHTGTGTFNNVGGLAGQSSSAVISASWADVNVSSAGPSAYVGGLMGRASSATITATYAKGAASVSGNGSYVGGLIGRMANGADVWSSYAAGPVANSGTGGNAGGLYGRSLGSSNTVSASYWDVGTTGVADDADIITPEGVATSDLQSVTSYAGVFANWNANVNGVAGNDDPWEFGQAMQYPRLKFGFDTDGQVAQGSLAMGTPGTNGDNPVVGQTARVCLLAGPTQRAAGTGGATYQPWQWYRSTDGVSWGNPITKTGPTYDYMPVAGDVGNYLRACVDVVSSANADRVLGDDRVCAGPFAKVQASGGS